MKWPAIWIGTISDEGVSEKVGLVKDMDYEVALAATELDFMRLTASLFLEMLDLVEAHMIKDFDLERFRKDVIAVFEGNGGLENVLL